MTVDIINLNILANDDEDTRTNMLRTNWCIDARPGDGRSYTTSILSPRNVYIKQRTHW